MNTQELTPIRLSIPERGVLEASTDFNIICILAQSVMDKTGDNTALELSERHVELLYDHCVESTDTILHGLASKILKADRRVIKQINLEEV
jgi:hypothetical protein